MGQKKPYFTAEFKAEAVRLVNGSEKPLTQVAKDIGVSESALGKWKRQAAVDESGGLCGALTSDERAEMARLRRENRQVKMERDFLKKAAAFFAREQN